MMAQVTARGFRAADRVFEVALGAVIWLTISLVLFPSGACGSAIEVAARTLERLARWLGELMAALKWGAPGFIFTTALPPAAI
jgi:hypothetical protein